MQPAKSNKNKKSAMIRKEMLQMLGERDESIRQTFSFFDNKTGQAFGAIDFKFAIMFKALMELGITEEKFNQIAKDLQGAQAPAQNPNIGGEQNDQPYGNGPNEDGVSPAEGEEESTGEENGEEHFSRS